MSFNLRQEFNGFSSSPKSTTVRPGNWKVYQFHELKEMDDLPVDFGNAEGKMKINDVILSGVTGISLEYKKNKIYFSFWSHHSLVATMEMKEKRDGDWNYSYYLEHEWDKNILRIKERDERLKYATTLYRVDENN